LDPDHLLVLRHLGDLGLLALLRALLLVAADRDIGALPRQLDQVLLGDRLRLLHPRALLPALWGPLVVLGDVDELAAPAWPAGDDRQLAHLAHRPGPESAARGWPGSGTGNGDQRPREDHRPRRRWAHREIPRPLDRLDASGSLEP